MPGQETEGGGQVTAGPSWEPLGVCMAGRRRRRLARKVIEEGRWPHAQVQRDRASLGGNAINPKVRLATSVEKRKC